MIASAKTLARQLQVSVSDLTALAATAGRYYRSFEMQVGPKERRIDRPIEPLKSMQARIYTAILKKRPSPEHLHGGVVGRSPRTNASAHLGKRYVARVDVADFFPSINPYHVYAVWVELGYGPKPAAILTRLTTYRKRLPQGAATSTALANRVLARLDATILQAAAERGCSYTRFVDDITLSGHNPQPLVSLVVHALREDGLRVKRSKVFVAPRSMKQVVTGLVVNRSEKLSRSRADRDKIRAAIRQLADSRNSITPEQFAKALRSILGRISSVASTNPGSATRLKRRLQQVLVDIEDSRSEKRLGAATRPPIARAGDNDER